MSGEQVDGADQEAGGGLASLVGEDFRAGRPTMAVDSQMQDFPACPSAMIAPVAGIARADALYPVDLPDIQLQHLAGSLTFVVIYLLLKL